MFLLGFRAGLLLQRAAGLGFQANGLLLRYCRGSRRAAVQGAQIKGLARLAFFLGRVAAAIRRGGRRQRHIVCFFAAQAYPAAQEVNRSDLFRVGIPGCCGRP